MDKRLIDSIKNREAVVGVIGLGYVGLPLVITFAGAGFKVIGFDIDHSKIEKLNRSESYIKHIKQDELSEIINEKLFSATSDFSGISRCDAVIICVPTPLTKQREPDMSFIVSTAEAIYKYVRKGQIFSLESTTYPGTTREVLKPILEKSSLRAGLDFFLAYSPEREDPNNKDYTTTTIPKVVGGYTRECLDIASELYGSVICKVISVSSLETAEATKLMENIFRCVNIALVNELKIIFEKMGINIWEVINAAKTKPFGFMPFYPGPGLGGHCIPIDPFYLTWKAREFNYPTKFIELAGEINSAMPQYVAGKTLEYFNQCRKTINSSRILLIGLAYKKNVDDERESPSYELWHLFKGLGAHVDFYDPFCRVVPHTRHNPDLSGIRSIESIDRISEYDCVVISTDHDCIDYDFIKKNSVMIIDTRNAVSDGPNVFRA